jgi:hypothetical protein
MTLMHNAGAGRLVHPGLPWRGSGGITGGAYRGAYFCAPGQPRGPIGVLPWLSVMLDLAAFTRLAVRKSGVQSGERSCARVAERQTRWLQVPVSERAWGFKSPLAHANGRTPVLGPGFFCVNLTRAASPRRAVLSPGYGWGIAPRGGEKSLQRAVPSGLRLAPGFLLRMHLRRLQQQAVPPSSSVP